MFSFAFDFSRLQVNVLEVNIKKTRKLYKNPHEYTLLLILNHQPANFRGEWS